MGMSRGNAVPTNPMEMPVTKPRTTDPRRRERLRVRRKGFRVRMRPKARMTFKRTGVAGFSL
jgi:hypothetical protein